VKRSPSIQIRAIFLLAVFSLNIVVGFACALGINPYHHHQHETTPLAAHHHHHGDAHHRHSNNEKDNCCNDNVTKIAQAAKVLPQGESLVSPVFLGAFVAVYYNNFLCYPSPKEVPQKYFEIGYDPPGREIRILVQSFQI